MRSLNNIPQRRRDYHVVYHFQVTTKGGGTMLRNGIAQALMTGNSKMDAALLESFREYINRYNSTDTEVFDAVILNVIPLEGG